MWWERPAVALRDVASSSWKSLTASLQIMGDPDFPSPDHRTPQLLRGPDNSQSHAL